jgi:hypothetical protein
MPDKVELLTVGARVVEAERGTVVVGAVTLSVGAGASVGAVTLLVGAGAGVAAGLGC